MLILLTGIMFWALATVALFRVLRGPPAALCSALRAGPPAARAGERIALPRSLAIAWAICIAGSAILLFRPHEDILGGQDQGSYVNSALTYLRQGKLTYTDTLLEQVPPADRSQFHYYGHKQAGQISTTVHVMRLADAQSAVQEPWFQPAYPLLMSAVAAAGGGKAALYVAPLFALLTALVLAKLAGLLFKHSWSELAAFVLCIANPLVAWHGRCARAEFPAMFFMFCGLLLFMRVFLRKSGSGSLTDIIVAASCLAVAPLFHITAWIMVLPVGLAALWLAVTDRSLFASILYGIVAGFLLFAAQTSFVTDPYTLGRIAGMHGTRMMVFAGLVALAMVMITAIVVYASRRVRKKPAVGQGVLSERVVVWGGIGLAAATVALFVFIGVMPDQPMGHEYRVLFRRLAVTDLGAFAKAVSLPVAVFSMVGWVALLAWPGSTRPARILLALILLPGMLLMGQMPIFMYFLRRSLMFLVPAVVLSLVAFVNLVPQRAGSLWRCLPTLLVAGFVGLGIHGRAFLFTQVDYKGLHDHVKRCAEVIRDQGGILLCEYSRIATPFSDMFGIPTLAVDNDHVLDYSRVEAAWEGIMRNSPGVPAFFVTPFPETPASTRYVFDRVFDSHFDGSRLVEQNGRMPAGAERWQNDLTVYRMSLRDDRKSVAGQVHARVMGCGNMGWRAFDRHVFRDARVSGIGVSWDTPAVISLPSDRTGTIILCMFDSTGNQLAPGLELSDGSSRYAAVCNSVLEGWWTCVVPARAVGNQERLKVQSDRPLLVTDILVETPEGFVRTQSDPSSTSDGNSMPPFIAGRCDGIKASFVAEDTSAGDEILLAHVFAGSPIGEVALSCTRNRSAIPAKCRFSGPLPTEKWMWIAFRPGVEASRALAAYEACLAPATDGSRDLWLRAIAAVPSADSERQ